jgi:uncharacterized protein YcbK (DUF882 family)
MSEGLSRQRRQILLFGAALGLGALPLSSLAHAAVSGERRLSFYNLHTGESLATTYWADGRYIPSSAAEIDFIFRDFRTGDVKNIDFRLLDLLHDLRRTMESDEAFHVISGFRSPKTNKMLTQKSNAVAKKSLHMLGMAADVRLPGRALDDLRQAALSLKLGGVGYYPKSNFIHVDVGRVRFW